MTHNGCVISPQRHSFDPRPAHVKFVKNEGGMSTGFTPNTSVFTCGYNSGNVPHTHSPMLYNLSNGQHC
jgi:hypothetical protein